MASSESLVNFRPFYTLQPVLSTRQRQLAAWMEHIIDWSRASRVSAITVGECELFVNAEIDRRLDDKAARAVLDHLVASGHGAWEDATAKVRFQVFWKKLDEWAADIYAYAVDRVWVGDVVTLSQLREGDDGDREDASFFMLDTTVLTRALEILEADGRARVIAASDGNLGIEFFALA